jgi:hypothetical protein
MVTLPEAPFTAHDIPLRRSALRSAVRSGAVVRLFAGVYVRADVALTRTLRAQALMRVVPQHAVVAGRTAAWLWGIDVEDLDERRRRHDLEVVAEGALGVIRRSGVEGRAGILASGDVVVVEGVRVTSPARTAADLGRRLDRGGALAALDAFLRLGLVTSAALSDEVARWRRQRGVVQLRELAELADARSESHMESRTRLRLIDAGFPPPAPQWWVTGEGGSPRYRLDLAWPDRKVAVEYDGEAHHGPGQRARDEARRRWLRDRGWVVLVVRRADILGAGWAFEHAVGELLGIKPRVATRRSPRAA